MIQKNTSKFMASGAVLDYIDDMFVVIAWLVSTEDADNPDIGCECRKVPDAKKFLNIFLEENYVSY